jgi:hypothetical protein
MKNNIFLSIVVGVLVFSSGFFAGTTFQKSKKVNFPQSLTSRQGNGVPIQSGTSIKNGNSRNGVPMEGNVISIDDNSITVQGNNGSNNIILLSRDTKINITSEGTTDDLKVGLEVMIIGNTTNGALTAQSISIGRFMATASAQTY